MLLLALLLLLATVAAIAALPAAHSATIRRVNVAAHRDALNAYPIR